MGKERKTRRRLVYKETQKPPIIYTSREEESSESDQDSSSPREELQDSDSLYFLCGRKPIKKRRKIIINDAWDTEVEEEKTATEDILPKIRDRSKPDNEKADEYITWEACEEAEKYRNALPREEQMDVYSSDPELVGLISELNVALDQLQGKVDPLLIKLGESARTKRGIPLGVKRDLFLAYRLQNHSVIARLAQIQEFLEMVYTVRHAQVQEESRQKQKDSEVSGKKNFSNLPKGVTTRFQAHSQKIITEASNGEEKSDQLSNSHNTMGVFDPSCLYVDFSQYHNSIQAELHEENPSCLYVDFS